MGKGCNDELSYLTAERSKYCDEWNCPRLLLRHPAAEDCIFKKFFIYLPLSDMLLILTNRISV